MGRPKKKMLKSRHLSRFIHINSNPKLPFVEKAKGNRTCAFASLGNVLPNYDEITLLNLAKTNFDIEYGFTLEEMKVFLEQPEFQDEIDQSTISIYQPTTESHLRQFLRRPRVPREKIIAN